MTDDWESSDIEGLNDDLQCETCGIMKATKLSFPDKADKKTSKSLELVHMDLSGIREHQDIHQKKYFFVIIDDHSRYGWIILLRQKSDTCNAFINWKRHAEKQTGNKLKRIRTDNGGEFENEQLNGYLQDKGIVKETTMAHTPQQNGVAERMMRTIKEAAGAMLTGAGMSEGYGGLAAECAMWLRNRLPSQSLNTKKTPFEEFYGRKPSLIDTHPFGSISFVYTPKADRKANRLITPHGQKGRLVGYSETSKGWKILIDGTTNTIKESRDVKFWDKEIEIESISTRKAKRPKRITPKLTLAKLEYYYEKYPKFRKTNKLDYQVGAYSEKKWIELKGNPYYDDNEDFIFATYSEYKEAYALRDIEWCIIHNEPFSAEHDEEEETIYGDLPNQLLPPHLQPGGEEETDRAKTPETEESGEESESDDEDGTEDEEEEIASNLIPPLEKETQEPPEASTSTRPVRTKVTPKHLEDYYLSSKLAKV